MLWHAHKIASPFLFLHPRVLPACFYRIHSLRTYSPNRALLQRTDEFSQTRRKYLLRKRREQTESNKSLRSFGNFMGGACMCLQLVVLVLRPRHTWQLVQGAAGLFATKRVPLLPARHAWLAGLPTAFLQALAASRPAQSWRTHQPHGLHLN